MKSDVEKIIDARVATTFGDLLPDPESRARTKFSRALRFGENRLDREDLSCSAQR